MRGQSLSGYRRTLLKAWTKRIASSSRLLEEYVQRLARRYPKTTIVLFGSRARGEESPSSDYDLAVIVPEASDKLKLIEEMRRLKPHGISVDLLVIGVNELEDPVIARMLEKSKILYNGLGLKL